MLEVRLADFSFPQEPIRPLHPKKFESIARGRPLGSLVIGRAVRPTIAEELDASPHDGVIVFADEREIIRLPIERD